MSDAADNQTASFYATHATELAAAYANAHPTYLAHLKTLLREPGATVLDVGCGTGRDVAELLAEGYNAYGIDPSPAMLAQTSAHYGIDQNRVGVGALPDAPAPWHQTYDAVLSAAALQHVSEQHLLDSLYRLRSLVSPSGFLLLSVPARYPIDDDSRDQHGRLVHVRPAEQ